MEYIYNSPVGRLLIIYDDAHVLGVYFDREQREEYHGNTVIAQCIAQLDEYFAGNRREFDIAVKPRGTDFQQATWSALCTIGYGKTASYGQIAAQMGRPKAARAVGMANNKNPISIIIPCHRVVGSDGKLVGYGGGLWRKEWLLEHEAKQNHIKS
ncbi:MAG: methylated-DNA--[protein]-cysteine S-methyltransferase [Clostridiales bacterium]|jgi:methylated-DNA-[protein]-cysteine S-methyltransferase|nr:methylated-DNA--[protein]-cysteine S-methyltransferase [Clostridiales bacterium]